MATRFCILKLMVRMKDLPCAVCMHTTMNKLIKILELDRQSDLD